MKTLKGTRVAIVGGGAFGLATALAAARRGAAVWVYDPAPTGRNASAIAAGMLGAAFEALECGCDARLFAILRAGLEAWGAFDPTAIDRSGAIYASFDGADLAKVEADLDSLDIAYERLSGAAARTLQPALSPRVAAALHVPVEGRVDPAGQLPAMARALAALGGRVVAEAAPAGSAFTSWRREFDAVVIAAGHGSIAWGEQATALAQLQPIKGHILHFEGGPRGGPVARNGEDYVAPQPGGAVFGATMQPGEADVRLQPERVAALRARAVEMVPELEGVAFTAHAGVRAATADGLPLAGKLEDGLFAATGARRNGWLLAPLVGETVALALAGEAARHAAAFDPLRFG